MREERSYAVYIMASKKDGILYVGVTNDLIRRVLEHKARETEGFMKKYFVTKLVWFDVTNDVAAAIQREKQIKAWKRTWKIRLIEETNPEWNDLYVTLLP